MNDNARVPEQSKRGSRGLFHQQPSARIGTDEVQSCESEHVEDGRPQLIGIWRACYTAGDSCTWPVSFGVCDKSQRSGWLVARLESDGLEETVVIYLRVG